MQRYLRQGDLDFSVGYKLQTRWGLMEAAIFTLECAGAGLFCASLLAQESVVGMVTGLALVALAILLLLSHLGHPARAWRAMLNVRTSWISRGTLVLGGFVGLGILYVIFRRWGGLEETAGIAQALRWVLLAAGAFILIYPGLVLSASPAIPFWNSALLPVFSAGNGMTSGLALFLAVAAAAGNGSSLPPQAALLEFWLLVVLGIAVFLYIAVMIRRGAAAAESAVFLLRGQAWLFSGASCVLGLALPMLLALWMAKAGSGVEAAVLIVIARLAGDVAVRHSFIKVGMFNPVV
jgi:formate-dependent nitrite reductase membrane component NrfD